MKAYKSNIKIDKLTALRDEFFTDRIKSEGQIWKQIRYASIYDSVRAENLLLALKLTPYAGCMNHLVDSSGKEYIVPNFCINDPYLEKEVKIQQKNRETLTILYFLLKE